MGEESAAGGGRGNADVWDAAINSRGEMPRHVAAERSGAEVSLLRCGEGDGGWNIRVMRTGRRGGAGDGDEKVETLGGSVDAVAVLAWRACFRCE